MRVDEIIVAPLITEKVYDLIERENKIAFEVNKKANKYQIKKAVEQLYNVEVIKVNTLIGPDGKKKAIIKLGPSDDAVDLASKLGLL